MFPVVPHAVLQAKNDQGVSTMMMLTPCFIWCSRLESNQWPVP